MRESAKVGNIRNLMRKRRNSVEAEQLGYQLIQVTIEELWEGDFTSELSLTALKARAREGILSGAVSKGNKYYYDRVLSEIRVKGARKAKGPGAGVFWGDIQKYFKSRDNEIDEMLKKALNDGRPKQELIMELRDMIRKAVTEV